MVNIPVPGEGGPVPMPPGFGGYGGLGGEEFEDEVDELSRFWDPEGMDDDPDHLEAMDDFDWEMDDDGRYFVRIHNVPWALEIPGVTQELIDLSRERGHGD